MDNLWNLEINRNQNDLKDAVGFFSWKNKESEVGKIYCDAPDRGWNKKILRESEEQESPL